MDRKYTLEDVEALRGKTGISYEEAVSLLDKYDGDMARALIELERRGVIGEKPKTHTGGESFAEGLKRIWKLGMRTRIHITKNDATLVNLSVLYLALFVIFAFYFAIPSIILLLLLGCRVSLIRNSSIYGTADIEEMVKAAKDNIVTGVQNLGKVEVADADVPAEPKPEPQKKDDDFPSITIE